MRHIRNFLWFCVGFTCVAIVLLTLYGCASPDRADWFSGGEMDRIKNHDFSRQSDSRLSALQGPAAWGTTADRTTP